MLVFHARTPPSNLLHSGVIMLGDNYIQFRMYGPGNSAKFFNVKIGDAKV